MKKRALHPDTIYSLISLISLWYINFYQDNLYQRPSNYYPGVFDIFYEYVAIATFYFFVAACLATIVLNLFNFVPPVSLRKILKIGITVVLFVYILFIFAKSFGLINISNIAFLPAFAVGFVIFGCLFALAAHKE